jgi:hypothetical protein
MNMPNLAKAYIATIAAAAAAALSVAAYRWHSQHLRSFLLFFGLAMVASTMKIRLPGLKTTISANFVLILMGIALFSFSETVFIGLGSALVQSLWRPLQRPKVIQVFFNGACLTVCTAVAFLAAQAVAAFTGASSTAVLMVVGACVYVVLNTSLVSLVVSLAEGQSLKDVWPQCYEWTFPYFLVGAAVAGITSAAGHGANMGISLLVVPVMYLAFVYYRMHMMRIVLVNLSSLNQENEVELAGALRRR